MERVSRAPQTDPGLPKPGNHPGPNKTTSNSLLWLVCSHVLGRQRGSSRGLWEKRTITRHFHPSSDWKRARAPHWANVDPPFLLHVVMTIAVTMGQGTGRWFPMMGVRPLLDQLSYVTYSSHTQKDTIPAQSRKKIGLQP